MAVHNRGKVVSGVYVSESGKTQVMTKRAFKRVLQRKGKSKEMWRKMRLPRKGEEKSHEA